jgi:hypothetical protein
MHIIQCERAPLLHDPDCPPLPDLRYYGTYYSHELSMACATVTTVVKHGSFAGKKRLSCYEFNSRFPTKLTYFEADIERLLRLAGAVKNILQKKR